MKSFAVVYLKNQEKVNNKLLLDFFKGLVGNNVKEIQKNNLIYIFDQNDDISFEEVVNFINYELMIPAKVFKGRSFAKEDEMMELIDMVDNASFNLEKKQLFTETDLVIHGLGDKEYLKKLILKKYYQDDMLDIIRVYLNNNMNISLSAKQLYMHRNTMMNKIDKFIEVTGYNIKEFKDAFIIYHLL